MRRVLAFSMTALLASAAQAGEPMRSHEETAWRFVHGLAARDVAAAASVSAADLAIEGVLTADRTALLAGLRNLAFMRGGRPSFALRDERVFPDYVQFVFAAPELHGRRTMLIVAERDGQPTVIAVAEWPRRRPEVRRRAAP